MIATKKPRRPSDEYQSSDAGTSGGVKRQKGFGPSTSCLASRRSTTELLARNVESKTYCWQDGAVDNLLITPRFTPLTINRQTALVPLNGGEYALIDAEDWVVVCRYRWFVYRKPGFEHLPYVLTTKRHPVFGDRMHRWLMMARPGEHLDHRNNNGLDNRRANLRRCSVNQNNANRRGWSKTGFKGVCKTGNRYRAQICVDSRQHYLGSFATAESAARAYDTAAVAHFGRFARPNFPQKGAA